ncbi:hypothetical protein RintRC_7263 [Richelia intracellularis]|nr:hypothetical protein RintRC_7263 [Richelia intracellularis]
MKRIIELQIQRQLNIKTYEENSLEPVNSVLQNLSKLTLSKNKIRLAEINLSYTNQCQILKVGSSGWERGEINIKVFIYPFQPHTNQVDMIFIPEPEDAKEYDALLEDILKIVSED